jgi:type I restriction enzyme S subunit
MSQWPTMRLGEICSIVGGGTPSRTEPEYFNGSIPWVTVKDFKSFRLHDAQEHISEKAVVDSATNVVEPGTVLLVTRVGLGKVAIADARLAINQDIKGLTPNETVSSDFLFWFLLSQAARIESMGAGATVKGVTLTDVKRIEVPTPPLPEQRRIVDLLSRVEGIVRLRREAEKKAAELIPALFNDMFGDPATNPKGWPVSTLGDAIESADYGSSTKASDDGSGVPLIRMGNVSYEGTLNLSALKFVNLSAKEVEKYRLQQGDILFNRTNSKDLVGKTGLWNDNCEAIAASYFIRLRVHPEKLHSCYLWVFMNSKHMKRILFDTARGAIGQANINSKELKAFKIALPPLDLQVSFAAKMEQIMSIQAQQSTATAKAQATFDALLADAFKSA